MELGLHLPLVTLCELQMVKIPRSQPANLIPSMAFEIAASNTRAVQSLKTNIPSSK